MLYTQDGYNYIAKYTDYFILYAIILLVLAIGIIHLGKHFKKHWIIFVVIVSYYAFILIGGAYFESLGMSTIYNDYDIYQPYIVSIKINNTNFEGEVISSRLNFTLDDNNYYINLNRHNCKYIEVVSDSQESYYELRKDTNIKKLVLVKYTGTNENKAVDISTSSELVKFKEESRDEVVL